MFELEPDKFQHHQLETVQQEQLPIQVKSITWKGQWFGVARVNYPMHTSIINPKSNSQIIMTGVLPFPLHLFYFNLQSKYVHLFSVLIW